MIKEKRQIILVDEVSGERKEFASINAAARFLNTNFYSVQRAALYNGHLGEWRVYEGPESIRLHIRDLERQLEILKG